MSRKGACVRACGRRGAPLEERHKGQGGAGGLAEGQRRLVAAPLRVERIYEGGEAPGLLCGGGTEGGGGRAGGVRRVLQHATAPARKRLAAGPRQSARPRHSPSRTSCARGSGSQSFHTHEGMIQGDQARCGGLGKVYALPFECTGCTCRNNM